MNKTCLICGIEFHVADWNVDRKYCGSKCRGVSMRKKEIRTCPNCSVQFSVCPSDPTVHCSHKCRAEADKVRIVTKCRQCGKDIETTPAVNKQFCNRDCYHDSQKKPDDHKRCAKCGFVKHNSKMANQSWCRECAGTACKKTMEKPASRHKYAKNEARTRGLEWTITQEEHFKYFETPCNYCGGPLSKRGVGLDRIDNKEGYHVKNVVPCCGRCNRVRYDHFTYDEMVQLGKAIREIDVKRVPQSGGGP